MLTSNGKTWQPEMSATFCRPTSWRASESTRARKREAGRGAIIDHGQWDGVQRLREYRAKQYRNGQKRPGRLYLLRGVATYSCGVRMAGMNSVRYACYRCTRAEKGPRCALRLEEDDEWQLPGPPVPRRIVVAQTGDAPAAPVSV